MSFSLAGNVITQTGTDTDLTGLVGIAGVTVNDGVYSLDNLRLVIDGTLDISRVTDVLRFVNYLDQAGTNGVLEINGTFDNSAFRSVGGVAFNDDSPSIIFDFARGSTVRNGSYDRFITSNIGSTTTIEGVVLFNDDVSSGSGHQLDFQFEGTTVLQNAKFINQLVDQTNNLLFVSDASSSLTINNCEFYGVTVRVADNTTIINGLIVYGGADTININTGSPIEDLQISGLQGQGSGNVFRTAAASLKYARLIDYFTDIAAPIDISNINLSSNDGSQAILQNTVNFTVLDTDGLAIENTTIYAQDVDNGSRPSTNYGAGELYEIATSGTLTYLALTDSNGQRTFNVISGIFYQESGGDFVDNRGISNGYNLEFNIAKYGKSLVSVTPNLYQPSVKNIELSLLPDFSTTEQDAAIVANYPITVDITGNTLTLTGDSATLQTLTAEQFYDLVLLYFTDIANYVGQKTTPITRSGNQIDAKALDVVLDYITFDPDDTITTTGTVTLQNGSTANFFDSNQDSSLSEISNSFIRVYGSAADRDARTNPIFEGTQYNFLFASVPANPVFLWVTQGNTELPTELTLVQGVNTVDLSTAGVLTSLGDTIDSIDAQLGFIDSAIYLDTLAVVNGEGTNSNPFNNLADALAKSDNENIATIICAKGTQITLTVGVPKKIFKGNVYEVDLNGQDISGATFEGASIFGVGTSGGANADIVNLIDCLIGSISAVTLPIAVLMNCGVSEMILSQTGKYAFVNCYSDVAGTGVPTMNLDSAGGSNIYLRYWSGSLNVIGIEGGDNISIDGVSGGVVSVNGTGGEIAIRGIFNSITDNSAGLVGITPVLVNSKEFYEQWRTEGLIIDDAGDEFTTKALENAPTSSNVNVVAVGGDVVTGPDDLKADVSGIPTNPVLDNDARLNNLDAPISGITVPTAAEIYTYFTSSSRENAFKADVAALATQATVDAIVVSISNLNDISPAEVTAAVPTATEIAVAVEAAIIDEGDGQQVIDAILQVFNANLDLPALELVAIANQVETTLRPLLETINDGVKNSSLIVPHTQDL